jgi:hypothetical protein
VATVNDAPHRTTFEFSFQEVNDIRVFNPRFRVHFSIFHTMSPGAKLAVLAMTTIIKQ